MSDALKSQCIKGFERASGHPPENTTIAPKRTLQRAAYPIPGACFAFWVSGALPPFFLQYFFGRPLSFFPSISSRRPGLPKRFKGPKSAPVPGPARAFLHALEVRLF